MTEQPPDLPYTLVYPQTQIKQFWDNLAKNKFTTTKCPKCGVLWPPKSTCPQCGGKAAEWIKLKGTGEIYAKTYVGAAPPAYKELLPYILVVGKLDEGPLVVARVEKAKFEDLKIGTPIKIVIKKSFGLDSYVFVPA
jgi:uncharacterized OB-fold protein